MHFRSLSVHAKQTIQNIINYRINKDNSRWRMISPRGKDLIQQLLDRDVERRIKIGDILEHKWFEIASDRVVEVSKDIIEGFRRHNYSGDFQRVAMLI